jgi:4-hydroxybenzoate polyprenyltransferase
VALPYTVKTHSTAAAATADVIGDGVPVNAALADAAGPHLLTVWQTVLVYSGVAAFTAAAVHTADIPDITGDRAAGVKTLAVAMGRRHAPIVSAALAVVGMATGLATGCVWMVGVGPVALVATGSVALGWEEAGIMVDDAQGLVAGALAAMVG